MADQALSTPPSTPPPSTATTDFDIISYYNTLLAKDQQITPPIAAIESLVSLLSKSPITTVSETLSLLTTSSNLLLSSQTNPVPVSAGTDLFQRYLITAFQNAPASQLSGSDFTHLRNQIITNSKVFVARAKSARSKIARHALPLIHDESTIITYGSSRVVSLLLQHAATESKRYFNVIQIQPSSNPALATRVDGQVSALRKVGIPVATISLASLPYVISSLPTNTTTKHGSTIFLLGTAAVLENGSAVSELGCNLVASTAKTHNIPVYVATESYKFARQFPLGCGARDLERMGTRQDILRFRTGKDDHDGVSVGGVGGGVAGDDERTTKPINEENLVDITPAELIAGLITENGVMTTNAVAEELVKLWF